MVTGSTVYVAMCSGFEELQLLSHQINEVMHIEVAHPCWVVSLVRDHQTKIDVGKRTHVMLMHHMGFFKADFLSGSLVFLMAWCGKLWVHWCALDQLLVA